MCRVSGSGCYSVDLLQGGLEVPCVLTFQMSNAKDIEKAIYLIDQESASFATLIEFSAVEKTNNLLVKLYPKMMPQFITKMLHYQIFLTS